MVKCLRIKTASDMAVALIPKREPLMVRAHAIRLDIIRQVVGRLGLRRYSRCRSSDDAITFR